MPQHPVPVFPLPGAVLFPGTRLALHVFELRYRTMVREALSGERVIALALPRPGWERDDRGAAEHHALGCLARIDSVTWLPDDCYDLVLLGLARVRLGRATREFPYRAVRTEVLPQAPLSEDDPLVQLERRALVEARERLAELERAASGAAPASPESPTPATEPPARFSTPEAELTFEPLVNTLCMELAAEPEEKLALLEMDDLLERARRAREMMEERLRWAGRAGSKGGERN